MRTLQHTIAAALAALVLGGSGQALAQGSPRPTVVYDYAVDHPTENAQLSTTPSIGASVPASVTVVTVEGEDAAYGYFYYQGRPVIVDLTTRSVVRIGN